MTAMFTPRSPRPRQRILGPGDSRAPLRRRMHGLTPAEQDALFRAQGGRCAICQRTDERLVIDHDHRHCPGRQGCRRCVRGLLCNSCNVSLAAFDGHMDRLQRYLKR